MNNNRTKRQIYVSIFTLFMLNFLLWIVYITHLVTQEPLRELPAVEEIFPLIVEPGDDLRVRSNIQRDFSCTIHIVRRIYDNNDTLIVNDDDIIPAREQPADILIDKQIRIPETAALGPATINRTVEWQCNWLQRLVVRGREMEPVTLIIQ